MEAKLTKKQLEAYLNGCSCNLPSDFIEKLDAIGFFSAPASTKYHGNYPGGLLDHSFTVTDKLYCMTHFESLKWERVDSPIIVGILHDLCKCDQYEMLDGVYKYKEKTLLKGHGDKSVMLASTILPLTEEEVMCIRYHMGAFTDKEEWSLYTDAIHAYSNVLWTHHADMLASHVEMI